MRTRVLPTWRRVLIWSSVALFYFYENILTTSLGVMTEDVMRHFSVGHVHIGFMASAFFTAYGLMQIPVGWCISRFTVRSCVLWASLLCVAGSILFAQTTSFSIALLGRVFMGLGASFAPLSAFEISAEYFHPRRFAMLTGLLLTFGSLGAIAGQLPFKMVLARLGFQLSMTLLGTAGLLITGLLYATIPQYRSTKATPLTLPDLKQVFTRPSVWMIMLYATLMYAPYLILQSVWGKPFIEEALRIAPDQAASLLQMMMLGFLIGSPLLGYISDRCNQRTHLLKLSSISTTLLMIALMHPWFMHVHYYRGLLFLMGMCCSGFLISFTVLKQEVPPELRSLALGVMNSINTLGGIMLPPLIGAYVHHHLLHELPNPYQHSLLMLPVIMSVAIFCSFSIHERKEIR